MRGRLVVSITRSTATETFLGAAKYYVDEMWPLVTRMYVWGLLVYRLADSLVGSEDDFFPLFRVHLLRQGGGTDDVGK